MATHPDLGMETTAGTFALVGSRVRDGAPAINQVHKFSIPNYFEYVLTFTSYMKLELLFLGKQTLVYVSFFRFFNNDAHNSFRS